MTSDGISPRSSGSKRELILFYGAPDGPREAASKYYADRCRMGPPEQQTIAWELRTATVSARL